MTAISSGSVLTNSWQLMYDVVTDQITDTSKSNRAGSEFVFSAWPNKLQSRARTTPRTGDFASKKWVTYPLIVLTAEVNSANNMTLNRGLKNKEINFHAEVYDKSQANADRMTNQLHEILDVAESGFEGSGLRDFRVVSETTGDLLDPSGALVHVKTLNWRYSFVEKR